MANIDLIALAISKNYAKELSSTIPKFETKVVDELPSSDISSNTIYVVRNNSGSGNDLYDEYIYLNNSWEKLGTSSSSMQADWEETDENASDYIKNKPTLDNEYDFVSQLSFAQDLDIAGEPISFGDSLLTIQDNDGNTEVILL